VRAVLDQKRLKPPAISNPKEFFEAIFEAVRICVEVLLSEKIALDMLAAFIRIILSLPKVEHTHIEST